jgi:hypothetical protein
MVLFFLLLHMEKDSSPPLKGGRLLFFFLFSWFVIMETHEIFYQQSDDGVDNGIWKERICRHSIRCV